MSLRTAILSSIFITAFLQLSSQINTQQVVNIGRNAMYFEDYILSIQYFNQAISAKPYLAEPYFYRSVAKLQLEDYTGAEQDATLAIDRNPFIVDAYQVRGIARQSLGKNAEAIKDYNKGLEQLPENQVFLFNKAIALMELKEYSSADSSFSTLLRLYPRYENGYLGRAQLKLENNDTLKALECINKVIELTNTNAGAFALRAGIEMRKNGSYKNALNDMNMAIKLEPHHVPYFINRAFIKYKLDDYFGAMADYDYAVSLEPNNVVARFNRGLLLAQVRDNNKAISDFSFVISREPNNVMARYNRAELYEKTKQYKKAIADYDVVIDNIPNLSGLYFARSECKRKSGDIKGGEKDYYTSQEMYKNRKNKNAAGKNDSDISLNPNGENTKENSDVNESEEVKAMFKSLLTIDNENRLKPQYDNKTRGRIQDSNFKIDAAPLFFISYYYEQDDLIGSAGFVRELTELNEMNILAAPLFISDDEKSLSEKEIARHFESIDYYTGMISKNPSRSIDYFARAIDFYMVKNYSEALSDINKAISLSPQFTLAYFLRANINNKILQSKITMQEYSQTGNSEAAAMLRERQSNIDMHNIIEDLDKVIELSPNLIYAHFNKGCILLNLQDFTSAISAFNKAIEIKPDFGEAYYNRGLTYFNLGNRDKGVADLSKAGELGITPSYSVLKRMSK